jgi:hypothetical protein
MAKSDPASVDLPVRVTSCHDKVIETTVKIQRWSTEQRTKRAWKRLAIWWSGTLAATVIPPHFPWLTLGFLSGPIVAWLASRQGALILKQDVVCPDCGTPSSLDEQAENWPTGARCSPCGNVFWISPAQAAAGAK